jgi:hypothetical protein
VIPHMCASTVLMPDPLTRGAGFGDTRLALPLGTYINRECHRCYR